MFTGYGDLPEVELPGEVFISDSTLREGVQMPGVVMGLDVKLRIYEMLHDIGVEKLECFLFNERGKRLAGEMLDAGYEAPEVTAWARAVPGDIDVVLEFPEIEETGLLMSVSDTHLFDKLGFEDYGEARETYLDGLQYCVDHGLRPRCHVEDVTRASLEEFVFPFVEDVLEVAPDAIIRLCDTLGYGVPYHPSKLPFSVPLLTRRVEELGAGEIEWHVHDDFGLGVANVLSGYFHGANWANLSFFGMGERAGIAELEKVLVFLVTRCGVGKYDLSSIKEAAEFLEREASYDVPDNKAAVGKNVFAHESGIHSSAVLKNPFTYEPYPPEVVGADRRFMVGDSSGRGAVASKLEEALARRGIEKDLDKDDPLVQRAFEEVQRQFDGGRDSCITGEEFDRYVEEYLGTE
ncbi:MAG: 2-isopropylmalate synthase [Methanonatronarchaeales archaeon]|nr:2-isopropylmalate synthase [Methanonatronarchaeales archaeon]